MNKKELNELLDSIYELEGLVHLAINRDDSPSSLPELICRKADELKERAWRVANNIQPETVQPERDVKEMYVREPLAQQSANEAPAGVEEENPIEEKEEIFSQQTVMPEYHAETDEIVSEPVVTEEETVSGASPVVEDTTFYPDMQPDIYKEAETVGKSSLVQPSVADSAPVLTDPSDIEEKTVYAPPMEDTLYSETSSYADTIVGSYSAPAEEKHSAPLPKTSHQAAYNVEPKGTAGVEPKGKLVFSINDRYRFKRELFLGSDSQFNNTLSFVASMDNFEEAEGYFIDELGWDPQSPTVVDFLEILKKYFKA